MDNSKHTPGPWKVGHTSSGQYQITPNAMSAVERCANARLIAAAPELLAALELLVSETSYYDGWKEKIVVKNARAALANATGQDRQS